MTLMANSWAMLVESWAIFRNVGKQLGGLWQCWQNSWAMHMLAEGWAIFRDVGKQLGSLRLCWQTVGQTLVCTDPGTLINAFESSAYGEEQNDSDFSSTCVF